MKIYRAESVFIPKDQNLTELLHTSAYATIPESHLIAKDSLTNRSITIGELRDNAGKLARGLKEALNPDDQDRWAIILPNSVEFLEIFHSILWTGGVVCPINHALKATEIGYGLSVSRPRFIVTYGKNVNGVNEAIKVAKKELSSQGVEWTSPKVITIIARAEGYRHIPDDFRAPQRLPIPHFDDTSKRLASIHLSSGTTGSPKGVVLTHYNFVSNCYQLFAHDPQQFHPASRTVAFTPWAHIAMTTMPLFLGPWTGMMHHAMPSYNLEEFGKLVGSNRATSFQGVPSVVLTMANSDIASRYDFSQAQAIIVGGAPLKQDLVARLKRRAPWRLVQAYGMTEAAGYVAYQRLGEELPDGVVGSMMPNMEACLKCEGTTEDAPEGGPGELWLRGPNITAGYAFNEEASKKGFPMEGWYNTGDVCKIDSQGRISVVGRTKDLIKYKGFQVSPVELESYLNSHPNVVEGGVGATWDESQLTELPTAWVILKDHFQSEMERVRALKEVHAAIDSQVSGYKKLRGGVWQIEALPKNPTGKILRKQLVEMREGLSCSEYALHNEPGVLKYAVLIPRNDEDQKSVYAIEEYADQAAFDAHMETQGVKEMIEWNGSTKLFDGAPTIKQLEFLDGYNFSRPAANDAKDPHILFADLSYHPDTVPQSLPYWKEVVETGRRDEPGTLVYGVLKDPSDADKLYVLETYESPEYLTEVHVPSKAIQESIKNTAHLRTGLVHTKLKIQGGFLHKE
ncbi:4-coumarate-CoA ligase [Xylariales sp. PMI_506]|nr:4-coumarate-CoA ligase [Xylariales sp. PMI_506]